MSNVSTVQQSTLSLSARLLTCLSDVPVSVLVGRTSVLDVFTVTSMVQLFFFLTMECNFQQTELNPKYRLV